MHTQCTRHEIFIIIVLEFCVTDLLDTFSVFWLVFVFFNSTQQ